MSVSRKQVALILSEHFDNKELSGIRHCLNQAGIVVTIVGETAGQTFQDWDRQTQETVDLSYAEASFRNFDAVVISDGYAPDRIRMSNAALGFIKDVYDDGKVVATIYHGSQVLISLDVLSGRNVAGWPSIKTDLKNAGANYVDEPVVVDGNLITARGPEDARAFCQTLVDTLQAEETTAA